MRSGWIATSWSASENRQGWVFEDGPQVARELVFAHLASRHREFTMVDLSEAADMSMDFHIVGRVCENHLRPFAIKKKLMRLGAGRVRADQDLEQREGRVHRCKNHAIRKNVATARGLAALCAATSNVWQTAFDIAARQRRPGSNDLEPYWLFEGDAYIERHVPVLPFSRDAARLHELRRALAIYRMVFGQSRQEDLIAYLLNEISEQEREQIVAELQINLSPWTRSALTSDPTVNGQSGT